MKYITLGKTGLNISRIGFGGIPIQKITADDTKVLFDTLAEEGINYIDTARGYTVSEEYIGHAIDGRRDKFILATKSMARDRNGMAADIDISLRNFRTDYIDLYQIHNPSIKQLDTVLGEGGALEALTEAKRSGKIGHIGITAHSAEVFRRALTLDFVETIMFPYNIIESDSEELIAECKRKNIGFIAMKPMAGGAIRDARLAMRYIFSNENVTVAIPGMYSCDEVRSNCEALSDASSLSPSELDGIKKTRDELGTNFCRRCNYCAPCSVGISIPSVFLFDGYLTRYGLGDWARARYEGLRVKASACIGCGQCETRCPYHLPIREMLRDAAERFESDVK